MTTSPGGRSTYAKFVMPDGIACFPSAGNPTKQPAKHASAVLLCAVSKKIFNLLPKKS